jgi:hypothetical protein
VREEERVCESEREIREKREITKESVREWERFEK